MLGAIKRNMKFFKIVLLFLLTNFSSLMVFAQEEAIDTSYVNEVHMVKGDLETLTVYSLTRLSLNDPSIVDIVNVDDKKILLVAKNIGQTSLFLWDEKGKRQISIHVYTQGLDFTKERLMRLFAAANIGEVSLGINDQEGKIVLVGNLSEEKKAHFDQITAPFANEIINLVKAVKTEEMVQVDMQITELNETLAKALGIDWTTSVTYNETLPKFDDGSISDLLKIGDFARAAALSAKVSALVEEGKARILSQPRLVVISGQEASFLVGGEIPIKTTTTTDSGSTQENVSFKPYGINMTVTPTVVENRVDVLLNVSVSEVDTSTASSVNASVAFSTRSASTRLNLEDGQLIILAGLIKKNNSEKIKKVPFLGDIPIVGLLFRSKSQPAELEQELIISLRPHILSNVEGLQESVISPAVSAATLPIEEVRVTLEEPPQPSAPSTEVLSKEAPLNIPDEIFEYIQTVQDKISKAIEYPRDALKYGWEGKVKIGLLILQDGSLALASVKESSGYEIFDENALNTAKDMAPYASFPPDTDLQELNITIPIVYSLNKD